MRFDIAQKIKITRKRAKVTLVSLSNAVDNVSPITFREKSLYVCILYLHVAAGQQTLSRGTC